VVETPGAGGYGPPRERAPDAVANDFASGKFSRAYLKQHYGFEPVARVEAQRKPGTLSHVAGPGSSSRATGKP